MKILIISDVHANVDALNAVWERENDSDYILFAGDMVDFGFFPKETIRWFMDKKDKLFAVAGNHDDSIVNNYYRLRADKNTPETFGHYTCQIIDEEEYQFLKSIPHELSFKIDDISFYMCHTPDEINKDGEIFFLEKIFSDCNLRPFFHERFDTKFPNCDTEKRIMIYGHTHLAWAAPVENHCYCVNPGSMSYRFIGQEPVRCADYIVYEDENFSFRHVDFDTEHLVKMAEESTLNAECKRLSLAFYGKR